MKPLIFALCVVSALANLAPSYDGTPHQMTLVDLDNNGQFIDYHLSASPSSKAISSGQTASFTVKAAVLGGVWATSIPLTCSGMPAASTCSLTPSSVNPHNGSDSSTLKVVTSKRHRSKGTPAGTYTVKVIGASGSYEHSTTVTLTVE